MRVMVLGASGYLGKKISTKLILKGYNVAGVSRSSVTEKLCRSIAAEETAVREELSQKTYDWIVNCVAVYEHKNTKIHEVVDANMIFALKVLDCAVECGVKNFLTIDTSLPENLNLYSFSKKQFAKYGEFYSKRYGITFLNLLLEMFYGEDEPGDRFLIASAKKLIQGEELLLTEGVQKRDIIYIDDVCAAIILLMEAGLEGFQSIPVGSGEAPTIKEIVQYMYEVTGSRSRVNFGAIPSRANEPDCIADIRYLKTLGFRPQYMWKQGLKHLCETLKNEQNGGKEDGSIIL